MLLCLISWFIITNIGCTSKISSLIEERVSNVVYPSGWKYLDDLLHIGRRRRDSYISCSQSPIQNNMTLKGGIQAGYFRKLAEHVAMQLCVELCCEDKGCDVAFMTGKSCYGVQCFNEELCRAFPAKRKVNDPVLISHVTFKGEKVVPKEQTKGKLQCVSTRIKVGATLRGGLKAGNFTDVGIVEDAKVCVNLCCVSEQCNVAMMINERCFLVSCFSTKLCQMTRSLTPLYMSSLAYVQRKIQTVKKDKGNDSLADDSSASQLVCKNSKIFYNSTLKGGYHAGNYTNLGIVANISSCIRWCCGNRDCDAAFMLENNCFAVACRDPDDCLPVHAKSSSSSAALKPRISYITSRSEEVTILEDASPGGICHAGIVSYDVTLRGGSNAGKFTPHGVVNNMKTCIFKCCQSEGCNVAMMLKDSCFTVVCDNDEKCEKKQTPISSNFNPRIAYVFRDKVSKSKKTASKDIEPGDHTHHHETLKHKKKMLLIQQLHALTSPREPSLSFLENKYNKVYPRPKVSSYYSPMGSTSNHTSRYSISGDFTSRNNSIKQRTYTYNINKKPSEVKHMSKAAYSTSNNTRLSNRKFQNNKNTSDSPLYDFLRGNFAVSEDRLHGKKLSVFPSNKKTSIYINRNDDSKGLPFNASRFMPQPTSPSVGKMRTYHSPLYNYTMDMDMDKPRNNINTFIWNSNTINYQSPHNTSIINSSDTIIPLNSSAEKLKHRIHPNINITNTTADNSQQLSKDELMKNSVNNRLTANLINVTYKIDSFLPPPAKLKNNILTPHTYYLPSNDINQFNSTENITTNTKPLETRRITDTRKTGNSSNGTTSLISAPYKSTDDTGDEEWTDTQTEMNQSTSTYVNNINASTEDTMNYSIPLTTNTNNTKGNIDNVDPYLANIQLGNNDPTCFRSEIFYNVTLRGGYDSGKFRDRGNMKDVFQCATLCCHLKKCDLVMMLSNRCFSVDCKSTHLCEAIPAKSPIFSPTICYVRHA